jgi:hypothetical protein
MTSRYLREVDSVLGRATTMSVFEHQRERAELVNELPAGSGRSPPRPCRPLPAP